MDSARSSSENQQKRLKDVGASCSVETDLGSRQLSLLRDPMEHSTSTKCCTGTLLRQMDAATAAHSPTQLQSGRNLLESAHAMGLDGSCSLANLVCFVDAALAFQLVGMCLIASKNIGTCYSSWQTSWLSKTTASKSAGYSGITHTSTCGSWTQSCPSCTDCRTAAERQGNRMPLLISFLPLCVLRPSLRMPSHLEHSVFLVMRRSQKTTPSCRLRQGGLSSFGPNAQH